MTAFAAYAPDSGGRPPAQISLRPATKGDVDAILRIEVVSGRAAGSVGSAEGYRRAIADPDRCVLIAETIDAEGRTIVGWAKTHHLVEAVDPAPPGHYLAGLTVDPAWRRRGVGAALTDARLQWIAGRATTASYVVNVRNRASIDLHRRWGFTEVLRAPRLMGVGFDGGVGLLMRLELRPAPSSDPGCPCAEPGDSAAEPGASATEPRSLRRDRGRSPVSRREPPGSARQGESADAASPGRPLDTQPWSTLESRSTRSAFTGVGTP